VQTTVATAIVTNERVNVIVVPSSSERIQVCHVGIEPVSMASFHASQVILAVKLRKFNSVFE
jgi:hypothetical protein